MNEPELKFVELPQDLIKKVKSLKFKNESDKRMALHSIEHADETTQATINWLASLVSRKGAKFDINNPEHTKPHTWPLKKK